MEDRLFKIEMVFDGLTRSHLKNEYRHAELGSASHYFSNLDPETPPQADAPLAQSSG